MRFAKLTLLLERKAKAGDRGDLASFGYRPVGQTLLFLGHVQTMTRIAAQLTDDDETTRSGQVTEVHLMGRVDPIHVAETPEQILQASHVHES